MKLLVALTFLLAMPYGHAESVLNVNQLNQMIKKSGAHWVAGPTSMSGLSKAEAQRHMGLDRDESSVRFIVPRAHVQSNLPPVLDWRNKDGLNWVSPILDQANCGSCVAFASIGTLETQYKIASGFAPFNIKLSTQNAFSCGGGACDYGWFPEAAARYLQNHGVPDEACMPYTSGATGQDVACEASCADTNQRSVRIGSYTTPSRSAQSVDAVKRALQHGPLVTTLSVYADFMNYQSGVYKHVTGDFLGGHAVSIIGYDDTQRAFIIRNSWGTGWGENGFAYISYDDESGVGDETWSFDIPSLNGAVSVENPVDSTYFSGLSNIKSHSTFAATDQLTTTVYDSKGASVWTASCASMDCESQFDSTRLPDGRYEVVAMAQDKSGQMLGQSAHQSFYIANAKPELSLSFKGADGTDLSRPLQGRIVVVVDGRSSTVPMSSVEFHYRGADGKDVSRIAYVVVPGLTMGWRTAIVPNGTYEIWLVGHLKTNHQDTVVESNHLNVQVNN